MPIPNETLEIDAQGREALVLDVALPVLTAWKTSVRIFGFRPTMGISGLSPREAARLRSLALATAARATGLFEGATDFRFAFPSDPERLASLDSPGVEADLSGHPLPPVVSDLSIAAFGLAPGRRQTHSLIGLTHVRGSDAQGYAGRHLTRLADTLDLDLEVGVEVLGFEPQGQGSISIIAARDRFSGGAVDWKDRGELRSVHLVVGGVRPKAEQIDRIEAALRETFWDARRIEPLIEKRITPGVDFGAFVQMDVEAERGGATVLEMVSRSSAPLTLARRLAKKAFAFWDSSATFDDATGITALTCAIASRADFELALRPSERLSSACALLRDLGAYIEENESPGLVLLKTKPHRA